MDRKPDRQAKRYSRSDPEKRELLDRLRSQLEGREEIAFAYVYGSFTEDLPFRDIDIGVYVRGLDERELSLYALALAAELDRASKVPSDVRVLNCAPLSFCYHVVSGFCLCARDEARRAAFVEDVVRRYLDMKPLLDRGTLEAFAT